MTREPREDLVLRLLEDNWTASNTYEQTPHLSFGWYSSDKPVPQVTVGQPEESPVDGGQTGFSGINPATGEPTKRTGGTIPVNIWSRADDLASATTNNPRQYNERVCEEVRRIIDGHADRPTNPSSGNQPVKYISYQGHAPVPETDEVKAVFRHRAEVSYGYGPE